MRRELGGSSEGGAKGDRSRSSTFAFRAALTILLRPQEAGLSTALALFLTRQGCPATVVGSETVRVELPHTVHAEQAHMEVDLYVRLWQALHSVCVEVIER
jgi:hypothetical protein